MLVVAVLAAVFTPLIVKAANPWGYVWSSAGKTIAGIADELDKEKGIMQAGAIMQKVADGKTQQDLEVVLETIPGTPLQDVGVSASIALDVPGEKMSGQYGLIMAGVPFMEASVEIAENVATAEVPKLFEGTYGVDVATIGEDFNRSAFAELTGGYLEEDFSYSAFELFMGAIKNPGEMVSPEGIVKLTELGVALTKEMVITRGSNAAVSVNAFEIKCEVYNITIPKASLEKFLLGVADVLEKDEGYRAYMEKSMAGSYLMTATLSSDVPSLSEMAAEQIELTCERLAELAYAFEADVEAVVSIAKNRVRKVEVATRMFIADEERDVQLTFEVGGENELTSDFYAEWEYSDYETSLLTFHREQQDGMYQYNVLLASNGYTYDLDLA